MTHTALRLLLNFDACAQRDLEQTDVFLHRRDRKFALTCLEENSKPSASRWMAYINRFTDTTEQSQQLSKWFGFWRRVNHGFIATGLLFGALSMLGLLFYDGGMRINITFIVAFVAFQLLLAILTTIASIAGWQPWRLLLTRFQKQRPTRAATTMQGVLMACASNLGGIFFGAAGVVVLLAMVILQDLAFGWSTTLSTSAGAYHNIISAIAAPWAWFWPAAAPDLALVEATRFFRAGTVDANINPAQWGMWWPFVLMLWVSYVLLPRIILFTTARALITRKANRLLAQHHAMQSLQYRMETPIVSTGNDHNDAADLPDLSTQLALSPLPNAHILLSWAGAGDSTLPALLTNNKIFEAKIGGRITLNDDQKTVEEVALHLARASSLIVLLVTRCWEPPTGELEDFIAKAKTLWPHGARVVLVPLATNVASDPDKHHIEQWLRFAQRSPTGFVTVSIMPTSSEQKSTQSEHTS